MLNINFVPDDYIQNNESRRTNMIYLILFAIVMAGLSGAFVTIKIRQRAVAAKEKIISTKITRAKEAIKQFEELQEKRRAMMRTALTTAELLEPVPKSVLLASLTNDLPPGVSLLNVEIIQKEPKNHNRRHNRQSKKAGTKYEQAKRGASEKNQLDVSPEKLLKTEISIKGLAPSDIQVAAYIESLGISTLLDNVAFVESREDRDSESNFREFELKAMLRKDVHLTKEDISEIRAKCESSMHSF
jgi:Tfp pilus assembly protein PilN